MTGVLIYRTAIQGNREAWLLAYGPSTPKVEMGSRASRIDREAMLLLSVSSGNRVEADEGRLLSLRLTQTQAPAPVCAYTHAHICTHHTHILIKNSTHTFYWFITLFMLVVLR